MFDFDQYSGRNIAPITVYLVVFSNRHIIAKIVQRANIATLVSLFIARCVSPIKAAPAVRHSPSPLSPQPLSLLGGKAGLGIFARGGGRV
jgi:hypothetical protein